MLPIRSIVLSFRLKVNVVVPVEEVSTKEEYAAATIRSKIHE